MFTILAVLIILAIVGSVCMLIGSIIHWTLDDMGFQWYRKLWASRDKLAYDTSLEEAFNIVMDGFEKNPEQVTVKFDGSDITLHRAGVTIKYNGSAYYISVMHKLEFLSRNIYYRRMSRRLKKYVKQHVSKRKIEYDLPGQMGLRNKSGTYREGE